MTATSTAQELFAAYNTVPPVEELYQENFKAVVDWLTKKHEFKLRVDDPDGIDYVYRTAFFNGGPQLNYQFGSGSMRGGGRNSPTYETLQASTTDEHGVNRSFLANDENFQWVKDFQSKNLLVPLVGNFGGPKVIRAVGNYVRDHGGTVTTFYLSNVEQYLWQGGIWEPFCASVATVPLDDTSTFIFTGRGGINNFSGGSGRGGFGGNLGTSLWRPMLSEATACAGK